MRGMRYVSLEKFLPWIVFGFVSLVGIFLVPTIGPAWDEPDNIFSGGQYAQFFQKKFDPAVIAVHAFDTSLFTGSIYTQEPAIARYPPIPNYVGTALALLGHADTGADIIFAFHIATVLFFALLVTTMYRFGRLLGLSVGSSVFASIITFLYPTLFGHGLSNLKDTAQVTLFTLSLFYLVQFSIQAKPRDLIRGSIVWGLALATKFNAIYVPIIWCMWMVLFSKKKPPFTSYSLCTVLIIGCLTATAVWPYLWFNTVAHVLEVIRYFTSVGQGYRLFWDGTLYQVGVGNILWWYPWMNLLLTTPIPLLILGVTGIGRVILLSVRKNAHASSAQVVLLLWFLLPLLRAFLPHAAFYDGMRHFLEVLPAGILMATIGFDYIVKGFHKKYQSWPFFSIIALLIVCHLALVNMRHFPYSTGYFNILAQNPNARFDRDIEALSVKEAIEQLHARYGAIALWSPIGGHLSWYYLTPQDRYVYSSQEADSIILVNKSSHIRHVEFERLIQNAFRLDHTITRGDAIFAWIYRRIELKK